MNQPRRTGSRILHRRTLREGGAGIRSRVLAHLSKGPSTPWWGQGRFVLLAGRRVLHGRALREGRAEIRSRVLAHLSKGQSTPQWGQGRFVRHMVIGILEPVSLCARFVGDVNSEPMATLIGVICPTCAREWDALIELDAHRIRAANETLIEETANRVQEALHVGDDEFAAVWQDVSQNKRLRQLVIERLLDRGVDCTRLENADVRTRLGRQQPTSAGSPQVRPNGLAQTPPDYDTAKEQGDA